MSDMPEFRAWADRSHRDSLRPIPPSPPRYKCRSCPNRVTRKQAKLYKGKCMYCKEPLKTREFDS